MKPRIFGLETEYGLAAVGPETKLALTAEQAARELFSQTLQEKRSTNLFLENGGRLYLDVGSHPEYATAECSTLRELLVQDEAGALLYCRMAREANQRLREAGQPVTLHLLKNNVDSVGNSCGCHENYLLYRDGRFRDLAESLITFFVTRQIVTGAGYLTRQTSANSPVVFHFSQRANKMCDAISSATTRTRPIVNTRDEPLGNSEQFRRMHVIVGDSNIAQPTTALKVFSTALLITALEEGLDLSDLTLANPMAEISAISADLGGKKPLELRGGGSASAVEIQRIIRQRLAETYGLWPGDDLSTYCWQLWGRAVDAVDSGDWSTIDTEVDWAIKYRLLQRVAKRENISFDHPKIRRLDYAYHDITAPLIDRLTQAGLIHQLVSADEVEQGCTTPPETTRAAVRGETIRRANLVNRELQADWVNLRLTSSSGETVVLDDPFSSDFSAVEALWKAM